jgi:hypothetical protein
LEKPGESLTNILWIGPSVPFLISDSINQIIPSSLGCPRMEEVYVSVSLLKPGTFGLLSPFYLLHFE